MLGGSGSIEELRQSNAELQAELERYRTAAELVLQQLDWCVEILHERQNHRRIARTLARNRDSIRRRLR
jgi:hypothetical protein